MTIAVPAGRHISIINRSAFADPMTAAFTVEAARIQLQEHLPKAFPGEPIWTIGLYDDVAAVKEPFHIPILLLDDDGVPDSDAWHGADAGALQGAVSCKGNPTWPAAALHEVLELAMDPFLTHWVAMPDGRQVAYEIVDPVQNETYPIECEVAGTLRTIQAPNFVTADWFDFKSVGPFDHMTHLLEPFELGNGYRVVKDRAGVTSMELGWSLRTLEARKFGPGSRVTRRMTGR